MHTVTLKVFLKQEERKQALEPPLMLNKLFEMSASSLLASKPLKDSLWHFVEQSTLEHYHVFKGQSMASPVNGYTPVTPP